MNAARHLSVGGVLGHRLGALRDSVLGKLTREKQTDSSLHLTGREGSLVVVTTKLTGLSGDLLKGIVDEGVHDGHGLLGDTGLRVHLLQHLVDVGVEGFDTLLLLLRDGRSGLLGGLLGSFGGHL